MIQHHYFIDLQTQIRLPRAKVFLSELKTSTQAGEISSDEKLFTVESNINVQNDRILGKSSTDLPADKQTKFRRQKPASVMVWASVSKTCKSPLIFVKEEAKVNASSYIEDIMIPVVAAAKQYFKEKVFTFKRDLVPSRTSKNTQEWCRTHYPRFWSKEMWPPALADLNPMDICVWSLLET
jgi:hypothetical protein